MSPFLEKAANLIKAYLINFLNKYGAFLNYSFITFVI